MRIPRVLVIDDEPEFHRVAERYLRHEGFECHAVGADESLKSAASLSPDIILLDIFMPRIDGFLVLKALRMDQQTSTIPVILVSGDATKASIIESAATNMNVSGFVRKPVDWVYMTALIRDSLKTTEGPNNPNLIVRNPLRIDVKLRRAFVKDVDIELGRQRFDMLLILAQRREGVTSKQLAVALKGAAHRKAIHTVIQTAGRLREDLRYVCGQEMIVNIPGGYKLL